MADNSPPTFGGPKEDIKKLDDAISGKSFTELKQLDEAMRKGQNPLGFTLPGTAGQNLRDYLNYQQSIIDLRAALRSAEAQKQDTALLQTALSAAQLSLAVAFGQNQGQRTQPNVIANPGVTSGPATNPAGNNPPGQQPAFPGVIGVPVAPAPRPAPTPKGPTPDQVIVDLIKDP